VVEARDSNDQTSVAKTNLKASQKVEKLDRDGRCREWFTIDENEEKRKKADSNEEWAYAINEAKVTKKKS
jgi:hypothetical protein